MEKNQINFLQHVFEQQARLQNFTDPLQALLLDEHISICKDFDASKIQESWSWRNTYLARELALQLISDQGEIKKRPLFRAIQLLEENLFSLGPERYHDATRQKHLLKTLKLFYENQDAATALKRICRPVGHAGAEQLIRETLFLPEKSLVTDGHARQATLAALLTSLRQNVGSCFATAPAILIQRDQPMQFLADMGQLLGTGCLKRIYEGVEYVVPLSVSWGMGDLFRPFYLSSLGKSPIKLLAAAPGLKAAFEAAGLIQKEDSPEEKKKKCALLLKKCALLSENENPFFVVTADQILKEVLMHACEITEQDLAHFNERNVRSPFVELVIQSPIALGAKSLACSRYLKAYEAAKWAFKALTDNALLKAWEFTLASLSESKADFAKWNIYASLGVNSDEPHGIGSALYGVIQEKIHLINEEIEGFQSRYDHLFAQAKYLEGRLSNVSSESEVGWVKAEYQLRRHEINRALSERDDAYEKGRKLQGLYPVLMEFYGEKIKNYFQEVYDAEMHDVSVNPYDDSPAGFRLMYKYGRSNTSLWTLINSPAEYIQHLTSFFVSTEMELNQLPQIEGLQKEISDLITTAIMTIKRPEFLESSFFRLAKVYHEGIVSNPLENLDRVKRKPWSYISGGTMSTLVSCYWDNPHKPQEEKRWVESENEYLAFLIDSMKEMPLSIQHMYRADPERSLLAFSPTHAFLCKPGWKLFRKAWESDTYTYTWIRDHWLVPQHRFLDMLLLDNRMMETILQQLLLIIPVGYRPLIAQSLKSFSHAMTPPEFREHIVKALSYEKWLREGRGLDFIAEEIDSILYRFLPLFPEHNLRDRLGSLFEAMDEIDDKLREKIFQNIEKVEESIGKYKILTAYDLKEIAKGLLMTVLKKTSSPIFYHKKITETMQKMGLSYPEPILFADTNWVKNVFGFTLNPGTGNLEFWRFDECGGEGRPIPMWKRYFNGVRREEWGLYTNPHQYGQY